MTRVRFCRSCGGETLKGFVVSAPAYSRRASLGRTRNALAPDDENFGSFRLGTLDQNLVSEAVRKLGGCRAADVASVAGVLEDAAVVVVAFGDTVVLLVRG